MEKKEITIEEKIDYIYKHIKNQEKKEMVKIFVKMTYRVLIILYIIYFYFFGFDALLKSIKDSLKIDINSENIVDTIKNNINLEDNNY